MHLLPSTTFIDGEIWFGRGSFQESQKIVTADVDVLSWHALRYFKGNLIAVYSGCRVIGFDVPAPTREAQQYEDRYESLCSAIAEDHPFIVCWHIVLRIAN